jgi:hypothetical protein
MQDDLAENQLAILRMISDWEGNSDANCVPTMYFYCPCFRSASIVRFINELGFYTAESGTTNEFWGYTEIIVRVKTNL